MLGKQHANLAFGGYIAAIISVAPNSAAAEPVKLGVGAILASACGLIPDLDEPGSTVSRRMGVVAQRFGDFMYQLTGGHRRGTHSLIFVALMTSLGFLVMSFSWLVALLIIPAIMLLSRLFFPSTIGYKFESVVFMIGLVAAILLWRFTPDLSGFWVPAALGGGTFLHIVGDAVTPNGVRFLYPLPNKFAFPINGRTGGEVERFVTAPLLSLFSIVMSLEYVFRPFASGHGFQFSGWLANIGG